jgi:signal transduction histidine kinase
MKKSKKLDNELIGILSHQLKAPVTTIHSLLKTIADGFTGETNLQTLQFIEKAIKKANEANTLIADLLHFRAYADPDRMQKERIDLALLATEIASSYSAAASNKDISLRLNIPENTAVLADANRSGMEIVFKNLIENALKYTPANGHVLVKLSIARVKKMISIEVVDSGFGIPENEIGSIFKPFFRSGKHASIVTGSGLGLAIAKTIVEAHKGSISVSSKEGKGSAFTIALPYLAVKKRGASTTKKRKVLIIGGVTAGPKAADASVRRRRL